MRNGENTDLGNLSLLNIYKSDIYKKWKIHTHLYPHRTAGIGQDDAGQAIALHSAPTHVERGAGNHQDPLRGGQDESLFLLDLGTSFSVTAPHHQ